MNKSLKKKVSEFEIWFDNQCYNYGYGKGVRTASNLYSDNLEMQNELEICNLKIEAYKKEINRLQSVITGGIDDFTIDMISDSLSKVSSAEILGDSNSNSEDNKCKCK